MFGRYTKAEVLGRKVFRRRAGRVKVRSAKNKNGTTSRSGCGDKWSCGEIFCPKLLRRAFAQPFPARFLVTDITYIPTATGMVCLCAVPDLCGKTALVRLSSGARPRDPPIFCDRGLFSLSARRGAVQRSRGDLQYGAGGGT